MPVVERIDAAAGVRYDETKLAKQAAASRRQLTWLLLAGAAGFAIEAAARQEGTWLAGTLFLALGAWRVSAGTLGGTILAALSTVLAIGLSIALLPRAWGDAPTTLALIVALLWGVAMAPSALVLVRDAELQHAFGMWARRDA